MMARNVHIDLKKLNNSWGNIPQRTLSLRMLLPRSLSFGMAVSVIIAAEIVISKEIGVNCGSVRIIESKVAGAGV